MVPSTPARPAKDAQRGALAFLVGLVGGIGLALMEYLRNNTVKTPQSTSETLARLPSLAVVPQFESSKKNGNGKGRNYWHCC